MLAMSLQHKMNKAITQLLHTWREPVLALKSIFPTLNHDPELVGDLRNQAEATRIGCRSAFIVIQLVIQKVISILVKNSHAVKCLDLTGFPVLRTTLEELFENKFNAREKLTILLDIWIPEHGTGDSNWSNLLNGSKNFSVKVQNVYICTQRASQEQNCFRKVNFEEVKVSEFLIKLKVSSLILEEVEVLNLFLK